MLSIAQVITAFQDIDFFSGCKWFSINDHILILYAAYVYFTNIYMQIIGVLLATLWIAHSKWADDHLDQVDSSRLTAISFRRVDESSGSGRGVSRSAQTASGTYAETVELDLFQNSSGTIDTRKPSLAYVTPSQMR